MGYLVPLKNNTIKFNHTNVWFTCDEHYFHRNVIKYSNRPFDTITEMNETLISKHNSIVPENGTVIHVGDLTLIHNSDKVISEIIEHLNGLHICLKGSHDYWIDHLNKKGLYHRDVQLEIKIKGKHITANHYALAVWPRSHYNSWHIYGHAHGKYVHHGKSYDVGVDNNSYYPVSFEQLCKIMENKPDNPNKKPNRR